MGLVKISNKNLQRNIWQDVNATDNIAFQELFVEPYRATRESLLLPLRVQLK